jgi:RNA polymerase sigma-70 factor (ECF subfamily)
MQSDPAKQLERNARLMELLARTTLADQQAFAELYRLTSPHLYAVALRILREAAPAEEVLQESFVNIWHHAGSYVAAKSQPLTWLTSIVRNRCLDQLRRRELETVTMDDEEEGVAIAAEDPTPLEMLLSGADTRAVRGCVEALEPTQKQAIALAFFQGLSHSELAQHLRQPLGTVKSWRAPIGSWPTLCAAGKSASCPLRRHCRRSLRHRASGRRFSPAFAAPPRRRARARCCGLLRDGGAASRSWVSRLRWRLRSRCSSPGRKRRKARWSSCSREATPSRRWSQLRLARAVISP